MDAFARLEALRTSLVTELHAGGRADLAAVLDGLRTGARGEVIRVVVCGETKRGKSTLVNSLVGRPLLSPVGDDVTTACWVELRYGDRDEAHAVLADPRSLGAPRRVPIDIRQVERYAAVQEVTDPVLGVEVRVRVPLLRDIVLVDTPGVGGLHAGHARTTLAALRQADVLLFVCDATQPVLAPEVTFLREAAARVPAVLVAVTKTDVNPDFAVVVADTMARLADEPALRAVPVFPVAAPLATRAADIDNERAAARLAELSGVTRLVESIRRQAGAGDALRVAGAARVIGNVARAFAAHVTKIVELDDEQATGLAERIDTLSGFLDDQAQLTTMVRHDFTRLHTEPLDSFATAVAALGARYRAEAERGPAAQLTTLAPRMLADLTALGITTLESVTEDVGRLVRELLSKLDIEEPGPPARDARLYLDVTLPNGTRHGRVGEGFTHASEMFGNLTRVLAGAATVITVVSGAGVVAACLALAAGIGWWRVRGDDERQRRAELGTWVDTATKDATARLDAELRRRLQEAERYVDGVLPALVAAKRQELRRLRAELAELRAAGERTRHAAIAARRATADRLEHLALAADVLAANGR